MTPDRRRVLNHVALHGHARDVPGQTRSQAAEHVIWLVHDGLVVPTTDRDKPLFFRPRYKDAA